MIWTWIVPSKPRPEGRGERRSGRGFDPAPLSAGELPLPKGRGLPRLDEESAREKSYRADKAILEALAQAPGPFSETTRSQLKRLIEEGLVRVNGIAVKANSKLKAGSTVEIHFNPPKPSELIPEDRPIHILYQDDYLIVVNKPPGLTVHPSATQSEGTLVHALLHHVDNLSGIGGVLRPGIVHRIDKDTSGVLVVSKTDLAHQRLAEIFSKHEIDRTYWAVCYGSPESLSKIESLIGRNPSDRKKMSMKVKHGKRAVTHVKKLKEYFNSNLNVNLNLNLNSKKAFAALLEVRLETGRTHQIRVHLTGMGHSLIGDPVYGTAASQQAKWLALPDDVREAAKALPGQALHARTLGFKHPITGQQLQFVAEPFEHFQNLLDTLEKYVQSPLS